MRSVVWSDEADTQRVTHSLSLTAGPVMAVEFAIATRPHDFPIVEEELGIRVVHTEPMLDPVNVEFHPSYSFYFRILSVELVEILSVEGGSYSYWE